MTVKGDIIHYKELFIKGRNIVLSPKTSVWDFINKAESLFLEDCTISNLERGEIKQFGKIIMIEY